jgi:predicted O-methyltransferase YrrM
MSIPAVSPVRASSNITALLDRLHAQSSDQESAIDPSTIASIRAQAKADPKAGFLALDALMLDKFIALEEDKCHFMYNLLLSIGATTIVEAGTSFGVSTIYLSLAVGRNVTTRKAQGEGDVRGVVIGTEKEESKAAIARRHWQEAGEEVERWINLKVGDLNETLAGDLGLDGRKVDFLLLDSKSHLNSTHLVCAALTFLSSP